MSHKFDRLLYAINHEPMSGNLHWRDVESLLQHLGAETESTHGARLRVSLNGHTVSLHRPHHSGVCDKQELRHLREFLGAAGVTSAGR